MFCKRNLKPMGIMRTLWELWEQCEYWIIGNLGASHDQAYLISILNWFPDNLQDSCLRITLKFLQHLKNTLCSRTACPDIRDYVLQVVESTVRSRNQCRSEYCSLSLCSSASLMYVGNSRIRTLAQSEKTESSQIFCTSCAVASEIMQGLKNLSNWSILIDLFSYPSKTLNRWWPLTSYLTLSHSCSFRSRIRSRIARLKRSIVVMLEFAPHRF